MLCYCQKCGRLAQESYSKKIQICDYCNNIMQYVPDEYLGGSSKLFIKDDLKEQFINEYIKSSSEFDQYLFDHRDQDLYEKRTADARKLAHGKAILEGKDSSKNVPKCPTCQSTNIRKMSGLETSASIMTFGIFSRKINKTWKCNNCGHTW